jgi:hypothetical protein
VRTAVGLLAALVLPAPERDRLAFRLDLPLTAWAASLCLAAAVAGGIAWALGCLAWMEGATGVAGQAAVDGARDARSATSVPRASADPWLCSPQAPYRLRDTPRPPARWWAPVREVPGTPS